MVGIGILMKMNVKEIALLVVSNVIVRVMIYLVLYVLISIIGNGMIKVCVSKEIIKILLSVRC